MLGESTRWTVIRAAADGNEDARAEFARRYAGVIRAYLVARWRGTPLGAEVDDAAQEVFLRCFRPDGPLRRADPEQAGGFRAYLYGVVRNVARTAERSRGRRREGPAAADLDSFAIDEASLSEVFDRAFAQALMRDAATLQLDRAKEKGPDAVRRHRLLSVRYGENLPIREIATRWGVDAAVLHREFPKAREEFKRALMDVVRDLHGGGTHGVERECARLLTHFS